MIFYGNRVLVDPGQTVTLEVLVAMSARIRWLRVVGGPAVVISAQHMQTQFLDSGCNGDGGGKRGLTRRALAALRFDMPVVPGCPICVSVESVGTRPATLGLVVEIA